MKKYDIIVWGCTGFTGRLVCQYLNINYSHISWAIAGRNENEMNKLKRSLDLKDNVSILLGDIKDTTSLLNITKQTKVLLSTAGPFAKVGSPIITACIDGNCHYCDITGESQWIRTVIDNFHEAATNKKLKIVNCCGYDCIPCDLGTQMIVDDLKEKGYTNINEVRFLADKMKGGASGGTLASVFNIMESLSMKELVKLTNPYYLNPKDKQKKDTIELPSDNQELYNKACDNAVMGYDNVLKKWTTPYIMQAIDTRIVNRSNALSGYQYGRNFLFTERQIVPGIIAAIIVSFTVTVFQICILFPITRSFIKFIVPKPGQGPNQDMLDNGYFTAQLWGKAINPKSGDEIILKGSISAVNGDPGYRQTAKMVSESALCLAFDQNKLPETFGILTPSIAMGNILRERLNQSGINFKINQS